MPAWLAVEDEEDISDLIMGMFEIWGIKGVAFCDGMEAINWIEKLDNGAMITELPQLALIDIRLPEASGIEVAARLRRSPHLGNIPIMLMTAYRLEANDEADIMAYCGADVLIYKPLPHMTELRKQLNALV